MAERLPEPWNAFLAEVDANLVHPVEIRCRGGFVLCVRFGLPRPTADAAASSKTWASRT